MIPGIVGKLITELRDITRDTNESDYLWQDWEWLDYLRESENEICRRVSPLETTITITLVTDTHTYDYTTDVISTEENGVLSYDGSIVKKVNEYLLDTNRVGWRDETGIPDSYILYHSSKQIRIVPTPTSTYDNYTVTIKGKKLPTTELSMSNTTPEIDSDFYKDMKMWALFRAYSKQDAETNNENLAAKYYQLFESSVGNRPDARVERIIKEEPSTLRIMVRR